MGWSDEFYRRGELAFARKDTFEELIGDEGTSLLDFTGVTLDSGERIIRGTSMESDALTGWIAIAGDLDRGDLQYATYFQANGVNADAKILGHGMTIIIESGGDTDRLQNGQFHQIVQSGATVNSRSGDPNAGLHNVHGKVQGDVGATWSSGCRVAPFWSDIQINGNDVKAEEVFHFFGSAGGSHARAFLYMEGQQPVYFLETDTALGEEMLASSGYATTQSNDPDGYLKVNLNGTVYGIPLMAAS